jgi:hypothetical protein
MAESINLSPARKEGTQPGERKTIAYLSGSPGSAYNFEKWQMWRAVSERARELGVNLVYLTGEEFLKFPQAILYDLIGVHNVDGIIFWNSFTSPRLKQKMSLNLSNATSQFL